LEEYLDRFDSKVRIRRAIEDAGHDDKLKLKQLETLLKNFLEAQYNQIRSEDTEDWKWQLEELTQTKPTAGIYLLVYRNGTVKFGMSFNCQERVKHQTFSYAAMVMDLSQMQEIVSKELLSQIKELGLPGLSFHEDQEGRLDALITMQLCEMLLACTRECVTATVGERLVQLPSPRVCEAVAPHEFGPAAVEFLQNIPHKGVIGLLSWPTLQSQLQRMKENSSFLPHRLHPVPKAGGFVTANCLVELLGAKLNKLLDSLDYCPRQKDLHKVLEHLTPALEGVMTDDKKRRRWPRCN
jgi:hypothetical protein